MNESRAPETAMATFHPSLSTAAPRVWARHRRCHGWCHAFAFEQLRAPATASPLFREIARQRFRVYCEERGFLSPAAYPDGLETDSHDPHAMHFAARYRGQALVASVRLVRADENGMFPFQRHCAVYPQVRLPRPETSAEISRLILDQSFRATVPAPCRLCARSTDHGEDSDPDDAADPAPRRRRDSTEIILMGLHDRLLDASRKAGIRHWFSAMEPALARLFRRLGFPIRAIGPAADYYGLVRPYLVECAAVTARSFAFSAGSGLDPSAHGSLTDEWVAIRPARSRGRSGSHEGNRFHEVADRTA